MRKKQKYSTQTKIFIGILSSILGITTFVVIFFFYTSFASKEESDKNCDTAIIQSTTFIKTHHLMTITEGYGVTPTRDGGYLLTGDTVNPMIPSDPNPFIIKSNSKGELLWSKKFSSFSMPDSGYDLRRIAVETMDGNFIVANNINGSKYFKNFEVGGDILVSKFNSKGATLWSLLLGDYSIDWVQKMWPTSDAGVILLARFMQTGYGDDIADLDAVPKFSGLIKINKNGVVQWSKKLEWEVTDMQYLPDESFVALAEISLPEGSGESKEVAMGTLPTIIKLDTAANFVWAKTVEMIPSEFPSGGINLGKTTLRMAGGDFKSVQFSADGGFIAIGFVSLLADKGLYGTLGNISSFTPQSLIAVKVDDAGNYLWAKKISNSLIPSLTATDLHVTRTVDDNFIIMRGVVRDSAKLEEKYNDAGNKSKQVMEKCKEFGCKSPGDENKIVEVKPYAEKSAAAAKILAEAWASNIELIKTDADFNPKWDKQIDVERDLSGYDLQPTIDKGVVLVSTVSTTKMYKAIDGWHPYSEVLIIKADTNGNVVLPGSVSMDKEGYVRVSSFIDASVQDQSSFLIMQNVSVGGEDYKLPINKMVKEKVSTIKDKVRSIAQYQMKSVTPVCSYISNNTEGVGAPVQPVALTWPQINYNNTTQVVVDGEKNKTVHAELWPILNEVFADQVKLKDNMKSMWLTYIFPRQVTRTDVEVIQKKYEALGYKIIESSGGNLWVSRVGLTLHFTFSTQDSMIGKVEVLF